MAGSLPAGSEGSLLSFLQGGTPAYKHEQAQQGALDKLIGTFGQDPRAIEPQAQLKPFPGFTPSVQDQPVSRQAIPSFKDNPGVPGRFNAADLPGAQQDLNNTRMSLLGKAAPQLALSQLLPKPPSYMDVAGIGLVQTNAPGGPKTTIPITPKPPEGFKTGQTREVQRGSEKITQEFDGANWKDIGSGPAFAPTQEPPPVEIDDPTSPTGRRLVPRPQALNQPGPAQQGPAQSANVLRDEFNTTTAPTRTVAAQYRTAIKSAASQSAAGDMGLIYSFMKALDPGSSVKEGEYAQGENLTGSYGKIWQGYNKAKDGEKLLPEVRADILNQMKNIYASHLPTYAAAKQRYSDIATRQRLNPKDVVTDLPEIDTGDTGKPPAMKPQDIVDELRRRGVVK